MASPSLSRILEAIAARGSVDAAAGALGIPPARVLQALEVAAKRLAVPEPQRSLFDAPPAPRPPAPVPQRPASGTRTPASGTQHLVVHSDGAARGNPGPAGAGAVVSLPDGTIIERLGRFLGTQTNNVAEYEGLIIGLEKALELGARSVEVKADSLLVINQLNGDWKLKHPGLKPYFDKAKALLQRFDRTRLEHVRREFNLDADEMSNRAIDERM